MGSGDVRAPVRLRVGKVGIFSSIEGDVGNEGCLSDRSEGLSRVLDMLS